MTMRFICSKHQLYKVTPAVYIMIDLRKIQLSALSHLHLTTYPNRFPSDGTKLPFDSIQKGNSKSEAGKS